MKMRRFAVGTAGLFLIAAPLVALAQGGPEHQDRFERADADGDGVVTFDEFTAAHTERFQSLDANGDGFIDADERPDHSRGRPGRGGELGRTQAGPPPMFDADEDGRISEAEADEAAGLLFERLDRDASGAIEEPERPQHRWADRRADLMERADSDGDGDVTETEFLAAASERFARMDRNGDGVINAEDVPTEGPPPGE